MKKKLIIAGVAALVVVVCLGGFGYVYMTKPNFRFTNTRMSDKDKGPQYVKVKVDGKKTMPIAANKESGKNITSDIPKADSLEEATYQIDQMINQELQNGGYSFEEPLVIQDPYQNSPLTAIAVYSGENSSSVRVTVKGRKAENNIVDTVDAQNDHIIPIVGLYPNTENEVLLEELDADGKAVKSNTGGVNLL